MMYCETCQKIYTKYSIFSKETVYVRREYSFQFDEESMEVDEITLSEETTDIDQVEWNELECPNDNEGKHEITNLIYSIRCLPDIFQKLLYRVDEKGVIDLAILKANELLEVKELLDQLLEV